MVNQFKYLVKDLQRWNCSSLKDYFYTFFEEGVWVTVFYRISRALFLVNIPVISVIFRLIGFFMLKFSEMFLGAAIKPEADIGPGLYVGHTGSIRISPKTIAGKNLSIGTGVILGERGMGKGGSPNIGDNVYFGTGSKILGAVNIGDNVNVGANAVVVKDIPSGSTAVGVPARCLSRSRKMESE